MVGVVEGVVVLVGVAEVLVPVVGVIEGPPLIGKQNH